MTPHESDADLITPEDVEHDVAVLSSALLEKKIKNISRALLHRPEFYPALQSLVASGRFPNEVEALAHAVQTLHFALNSTTKN